MYSWQINPSSEPLVTGVSPGVHFVCYPKILFIEQIRENVQKLPNQI